MREVKFRSWTVNANGTAINRMDYMSNQSIFEWEADGIGMHIMQSIGLRDKNGKEIYEGDIIKVNTKIVVCEDDDFFAENELKEQEITCYVSYTEKFAAFELITIEEDRFLKAWGFYGEEDAYTLEIIGNIYENSELLKP